MFAKSSNFLSALLVSVYVLCLASCGNSQMPTAEPAAHLSQTPLPPKATAIPPTLSPLSTSLAQLPSPSSVITETTDSGWVVYKDVLEGFAIALPPSWKPMEFSAQEIGEILDKAGNENPKLGEVLHGPARSEAAGMMKFVAFDFDNFMQGYATNVSVASFLFHPDSLDVYVNGNIKLTESLTSTIKPVIHKRIKVDGFDAEEVHYESTNASKSGNVSITQIYLLSKRNFFIISLSTISNQMPSYTDTFDKIIQSFQLSGANK